MSDDVKDLLDRAAADSLRGVHLDLPTAEDVARWETTSPASAPGAPSGQGVPSVPEAQVIPLDATRRRARWPLGLAAAVLAILAIGGGLVAVQSADDPSPATPTTVPNSEARQRLLAAIDASVAKVFEVHYSGASEDTLRCGDPACLPETAGMPDEPLPEMGTVWDGSVSGFYVKVFHGAPLVTKIVAVVDRKDPSGTGDRSWESFYETGPDQWVIIGGGDGSNPLLDFRRGVEGACVFDRDGKVVVALDQQTPCGPKSGIQYEVTLDGSGRVVSIDSDARAGSLAKVKFDYSDIPRPRIPDLAKVTTRPNAVATEVDPVTGYWTIQDVDSMGPVPTTSVVTEVGGP